jgi:hypothetical protein
LRNAVLSTLNDAVPNVVIADGIQELSKNTVVSQLWHILHCDKIGLRLIDETAEFCDKSPFGVRARLSAFPTVGGKRLTWRTSRQQGICVIRPDCQQVISAEFTDVLVHELGIIVRLVWESALWINIEASKDSDSPSNETVSKAADATEKIDARNHISNAPMSGRHAGLMNRYSSIYFWNAAITSRK